MNITSDTFKTLVKEEINSVNFVMDYVEFHFNGKVIVAYSNPILTYAEKKICFPEKGSRDELCSLISSKVSNVEYKKDVALELFFDDGKVLTIPLDEASKVGQEALCFGDGTGIENAIYI